MPGQETSAADRAHFERCVWKITGRRLTPQMVAAITDLADDWSASRGIVQPLPVLGPLYHVDSTDLHEVIGVLADALLPGRAKPEVTDLTGRRAS